MKILAFDTCLGACSVALAWDQGRRTVSRFERMERGHAERLVPMIGEVLAEAPFGLGGVEQIHVTVGPGTFTGARIGIAAARAFALSSGAKLAGLTSLELLARTAQHEPDPPDAGEDLLATIDARRDQVYVQLFRRGSLVEKSSAMLVGRADLVRLIDRKTTAIGSAAQIAADAAPGLVTPRFPSLEPNARYMLTPLAAAEGATLAPLYLRPPDAKPQDGKSLPRAS